MTTLDNVFFDAPHNDGESAQTTADIIAHKIRSAIIEGRLPGGYKLREVELAARMSTSRTPIREAFRALQSEGYLEHMPRCGVVVAALRDDEVSDLWELRSILEREAAAKAARNISSEQLALLQETQRKMEALGQSDHHEFSRLDTILHQVIANAGGNAKLEESINRLWHTASLARTRSIFWRTRAISSCGEHGKVVEAIAAGDEVLARRYMEIHFIRSLQAILAILRDGSDQDGR